MADSLEALLAELKIGLREREEAGLRRDLTAPRGVDFSSNDYLGLSGHPRIREALSRFLQDGPVGAPASRLMRGNTSSFGVAEAAFARFKGAEAALLFPSGYQANLGMLTALVTAEDRVLSDQRNHASLIDGLRLTGCKKVIYPHLDLGAVESILAQPHPAGRTYLVTESLFSVDGDTAPLAPLAELADRHNALLMVDDAHATGLFGSQRGSGLLEAEGIERRVLGATSTGGKALGLCGAFVTGSRVVIEHLLNHARPFIYSTAPLPLLAVALTTAVEIVQAEPWLRDRVHQGAARLRLGLRDRGVSVADGVGPIVPVAIGDDHLAVEVARLVQDEGYDVRALRPPTVPQTGAVLRVSVHANHTEEQIDGVSDAIAKSLSAIGIGTAGHS